MDNNEDGKPQFESPAADHEKPMEVNLEGESFAHASSRLPDNTPRICVDCGKICRSGKALGGHRRIHFQATKKEARIKLRRFDNPDPVRINGFSDGVSFTVSDPITCSLCNDGRTFTSMKGLFGHMRSHPEREWRGINPPNNEKHSPASTISDDHDQVDGSSVNVPVVDLMGSLRDCPVIPKRGRSQLVREASGSACGSRSGSEEEVQMQEAVNHLLMIAGAKPNDSASSKNKSGTEVLNPVYDYVHGSKIPLRVIKNEKGCDFGDLVRMGSEIAVNKMDKGNGMPKVASRADVKDSSLAKEVCKGMKIVISGSGVEDSSLVGEACKGKTKVESRAGVKDSNLVKEALDHVSQAGHRCIDNVKGKIVEQVGVGSYRTENGRSSCKSNWYEAVVRERRNIKKKRLADLEKIGELVDLTQDWVQVIPNRYVCITCEKSFATHQALGGHRASHSRQKNTTTMNQSAANVSVIVNENSYCKPTINVKVERQVSEVAAKGSCLVAPRSGDPTVQALGGHKRCQARSTSTQVASSAGEVTQTARRLNDFDLNLPPPSHEDDDQVIQPV